MLKCRDFYAQDTTPFLALSRKYEPIESVLDHVNVWIGSEKVKVFNVETVASACAFDSAPGYCVRVWYEE